jgi:hypothetical protein
MTGIGAMNWFLHFYSDVWQKFIPQIGDDVHFLILPRTGIHKTISTGTLLPAPQVLRFPSGTYVAHQGRATEGDPNAIFPCTPMCLHPSSGWPPPIDQGREVLLQQ